MAKGDIIFEIERWAVLQKDESPPFDDEFDIYNLYTTSRIAESVTCPRPTSAPVHEIEDCRSERQAAGTRIVKVKLILVDIGEEI